MFRRNRRGTLNASDVPDVPDIPMNWRRLIGYLGPYKARMALAILALMLSAALNLVFPFVIGQVVNSVLTQRNFDLLNQITIGLLVVFVFRSITSLIENYNLNYIGERIVVDLRQQLYNHLQKLSLGFFVQRRVGELVSRMSSDVTALRSVLTNNVNVVIQQSLTMVGSVALMLALNWRLSLFILVLTPIIIGIAAAFSFWLQRTSTRIQDELAGATVVSEEVLQNIREVKSFVREDYEIKRYESAIGRAFDAALLLRRIRSVLGPLIAFLGFGALALILWFGGREVIENRLLVGDLITFLILGGTVAGALGSFIGLYSSVQEAIGSTKRVFQILDTEPDIADMPDAQVLTRAEGRITFEGVHFSYDERQEVLHDLSLDIAPGEIVALVGPSGAGKSTIFNLIPRFYDPTEGAVRVDGHDLREVTQASLREQIGIVPQETLLFGGRLCCSGAPSRKTSVTAS